MTEEQLKGVQLENWSALVFKELGAALKTCGCGTNCGCKDQACCDDDAA
jgi:enamine deaminase RidA (YjgF/YER057c/UK114 family)